MTDSRQFEFGGFRLDPVRRLLFDARGETIPLNSRAFDTLLHFLENPGGLLAKQALMKAVWPNSIVEENNLNQCVLTLRRTLGESAGENRFIVTVPGRGYRFVAPVRVRDADSQGVAEPPGSLPLPSAPDDVAVPPAPGAPAGAPTAAAASPRGWWITRLLVPLLCLTIVLFSQVYERRAGHAMAVTSIAVLPFRDMSADGAQQPLSVGIADELITQLGTLRNLRVAARASSFAYRSRAQDLRSIGRALRVDHVLEGSIRAADDRLRVSVQLVETDSGVPRWSQSYERPLGSTLAMQEELARTIAAELGAALGTTDGSLRM